MRKLTHEISDLHANHLNICNINENINENIDGRFIDKIMDIVMDIIMDNCLNYVDIKHLHCQNIYISEWGGYLNIYINWIFNYLYQLDIVELHVPSLQR